MAKAHRPYTGYSTLLIVFVAAILVAGPVHPGEISLRELATELNAEIRYDPFLELGRIQHGGHGVRFAVGSDEMRTDDGKVLSVTPPTSNDGSVYIDESTATQLKAIWRPTATDRDEPFVSAIVIDPGHGGRDPGTIGRHVIDGEELVVREKDIVLDVSLHLRDLLRESFDDRRIILTREDDRYLPLDTRTDMANDLPLGENEYVVYVSVHANASLNTRATGFEAWFIPPEQRRTLIDPDELDADRRRIHAILNSMREEEVSVHSAMLGNEILSGLEQTVGARSPNRGLKQENWAVVRNALMPSVLVELGFVTNREEAQLLSAPEYLHKLAVGLYTGIRQFVDVFETSNSDGT